MAQRGFSSLWAHSATAGWAVTSRNSQMRRDWSMATTICKTSCCFLWRSSQRTSLGYIDITSHTFRWNIFLETAKYTLTFHTCLVQVFTRAMLGCVSELQASMGAVADLSPAWIMAAAKHFAPRLDTLTHIFLLEPELVTEVFQQGSKREPQEMVRITFKATTPTFEISKCLCDYCIYLLKYKVVWKHLCKNAQTLVFNLGSPTGFSLWWDTSITHVTCTC